nr:histidine kinase [uncultured Holophaga sp.]
MHPILGSRVRMAVYCLAWLPVAVIFAMPLLGHASLASALMHGLLSAYLAALAMLSSYYLCKAMPLKGTHPWVLALTWVLAAAGVGLLWRYGVWLLEWSLGDFVAGFWDGYARIHKPGSMSMVGPFHGALMVLVIAILYLLVVAINYLLIERDRIRDIERSEQEQRVLAREAELKALRAQLNPHFLFNSLNSISALTSIDAKRARQMCVLLSDFLRKSLKLGEQDAVSLAEEVDLVRNYLAIEQIRFGARLEVVLELDPGIGVSRVPPLLLQPLVENAIKHGISQVAEGGVLSLRASRRGDFAEIQVENPVDPDADAPVGLGLGLKQVKQRLEGRFQARTRFESGLFEGRHRVVLIFPLDMESGAEHE